MYKIGVLKNFAKFTGKDLMQYFKGSDRELSLKTGPNTKVFYCKFYHFMLTIEIYR